MLTPTLPTFRALTAHAAALYLSVSPGDGCALVLADLAPITPLQDDELLCFIQSATTGICAIVTLLQDLGGHPDKLALAVQTRKALHAAFMAFYGKEV